MLINKDFYEALEERPDVVVAAFGFLGEQQQAQTDFDQFKKSAKSPNGRQPEMAAPMKDNTPPPAAPGHAPLPMPDLRRSVDPAGLGFASTADLEPAVGLIGQDARKLLQVPGRFLEIEEHFLDRRPLIVHQVATVTAQVLKVLKSRLQCGHQLVDPFVPVDLVTQQASAQEAECDTEGPGVFRLSDRHHRFGYLPDRCSRGILF